MIEFSVIGHLGLILLNRVTSLNALSLDMWKSIDNALSFWKDDANVKVIVIESASHKFFSAGGDVRELYSKRQAPLEELMVFFKQEYQTIYHLHTYPKPIISLMNGVTMGGGVGLGMHVAFPIAGENILFAMPETAIGLFPDVGASYLFNRVDRSWRNYLGLLGGKLNLAEVCKLGFVKAYIPTQIWPQLKQSLSAHTYSGDIFKQVQELISQYQENSPVMTPPCQQMALFDTQTLNELVEHVAQQPAPFFQELNHKIATLSPLSLVITFEQIQLTQGKNLKDCLAMDYNLMGHFMSESDFFEGVRALLIDKDKKPQWRYQTIEEVPFALVQEFFYL